MVLPCGRALVVSVMTSLQKFYKCLNHGWWSKHTHIFSMVGSVWYYYHQWQSTLLKLRQPSPLLKEPLEHSLGSKPSVMIRKQNRFHLLTVFFFKRTTSMVNIYSWIFQTYLQSRPFTHLLLNTGIQLMSQILTADAIPLSVANTGTLSFLGPWCFLIALIAVT